MADASAPGARAAHQLGNLANGTRPMSASSPVSLLLERMAAGETVIPIVDDISSEMYIGAADREVGHAHGRIPVSLSSITTPSLP